MNHRAAMSGLVLSLFLLLLSLPAGASQAQSPLQDVRLVVSLEWQPSSADTVLEAKGNTCSGLTSVNIIELLKRALDATSADVYGYSAGQVWISHYSLYSNGEHWDDADIRILASSDFRPTAYLGGFEKLSRKVDLPGGRTLTLNPGSIFVGRLWNGLTAACGDWNAPAGVQTLSSGC